MKYSVSVLIIFVGLAFASFIQKDKDDKCENKSIQGTYVDKSKSYDEKDLGKNNYVTVRVKGKKLYTNWSKVKIGEEGVFKKKRNGVYKSFKGNKIRVISSDTLQFISYSSDTIKWVKYEKTIEIEETKIDRKPLDLEVPLEEGSDKNDAGFLDEN